MYGELEGLPLSFVHLRRHDRARKIWLGTCPSIGSLGLKVVEATSMVLIKTSAHNKVLVVAVHLHPYTASWPYSSLTLLEALALKKLLFKYFIVFKAPFLHSLYQGLFSKFQ